MSNKKQQMLEYKEYANMKPETRTMLLLKYNSNLYQDIYAEVMDRHYFRDQQKFLSYQRNQFNAFWKAKKKELKQLY